MGGRLGSSWAGDSQQYGATFEQTPVGTVENDFAYTEGDGITNAKYRVTQDVEKPYGWFSGSEEGDESKIVARTDAAGGHALQLNTDANTLTNQLAKSVAEKLNNVLAGENGETQGVVYFETDVKFVASDTDDAGIKGNTDATKFAIYAYCKDDVPEGQEVTTNLVVYHAYQYVDENDDIITDFTNEVFKSVSIDTEVYTKLRIEMKKLEVDEGAYQNVFSVSINGGDPISSATALDKVLDPTAPGIWFQTVEDAIGGANNAKVAALNFKGTGEIDNIKAGVIQIETTSATVIFVAADGTTELDRQTLEVGATPAYAGAASGTNNTATASGISTFTGWTCGEDFYAVGEALPATVNGETTYVATFSTVPAVASVNGAYYASLADAVAAAIAAGGADPVVLNGNVALDDWILVDGAVTIDLAGYTISKGANWIVATPAHDALVAVVHGGSLTVNDSSDPSAGMIDGSTLPCGIKMTIAGDTDDTNPATLVVNGGTIKGQNYAIAGNGLAGRGNTAITINGGVILGTDPTGDSCGIFHPQAGTLTINGGRIEGGQGVWMKSGTCVCTVTAGEIVGTAPLAAYVTSKNGFNSTGDAFVVDNVGYPGGAPAPSILGGTFVSSNANAVASYSNAANEPIGGFVAGGTFSTPVPADYCAEGYEPDSWEEEGVTYYGVKPTSPATVITIALVNGATYTDAEGVLTFAAPEGYVVNSIYTNGVDTGSTTTFTTNGLTGTINIVAAAKKVRPAVAHKWYENPGLVVKVPHPLNDSCVGQNWGHDLTDSFVGGSAGYTGGFARLLSIDSLEAGNAEPIYTINVGAAPLNIPTFRGSAISPKLNVMLLGGYNETKLVSLPLTNETLAWDENAFHIWTDNGVVPDAMYFSDDCQTLYANAYSPDANQKEIYKYRVLDGLKSSGTNLVLEATWNVGTRTRNTVFVEVGNKVFAYFHDNGTIKCIDLSDTSSSPVDTVATVTSKYDSVGATSSHLYVVHGSTGAMDIYDIAADGSVTLFKSFTGAELGAAFGTSALSGATSTAIVVTEDEATAIFGGITGTTHYIFVAQYVEPPTPTYDVDWTGSDGVTVTTNGIALTGITSGTFEENTVITFTPDQDTTITNILVDGVAQTGFDPASFTLTVVSDTNIVVLAGASAADDYTAGDTVGAETLNADVAAWLNTKKGTATKAAFEETLDEDGLTLFEEYLLNTDPTVDTTVEFKISSIAVGDTVDLQVTLTRTEGNEAVTAAINGELQIVGATSLDGTFGNGEAVNATFEGATTAAKSLTTQAKFFKAVIVQKSAPAGN